MNRCATCNVTFVHDRTKPCEFCQMRIDLNDARLNLEKIFTFVTDSRNELQVMKDKCGPELEDRRPIFARIQAFAEVQQFIISLSARKASAL